MKHPLHDNIVKSYNRGYSYSEIAEIYDVTRSTVAGIIWRIKNPGMWTKKISHNHHIYRKNK